MNNKKKILKVVLVAAAAAVVLILGILAGMIFTERPAAHTLAEYQVHYPDTFIGKEEDGTVSVLPVNGAGKNGVIFYTGAQIVPEAYVPLAAELAEQGVSCWIPEFPCNMAVFTPEKAVDIIKAHPDIENWYIGGHSMGGLVASGVAADHSDAVSGLFLLASYVNRDMAASSVPVLSVYGDADSVLNRKNYEGRSSMNPADFEEHILPGGNHAQYGDYGKQPRDTDAAISAEQQRADTAAFMLEWMERTSK